MTDTTEKLPTAEQTLATPEKPTTPQRGLGRVYIPNPGSRRYPVSAALRRTAYTPANWKSRRWQMGGPRPTRLTWRDQSWTSKCVEFGETHILMLEPIVRFDAAELTRGLYEWAQANDYWPGTEPTYYGTSVDAGLQFLLHQIKVIKEYRWVTSMDDVLARLSATAKNGGGPIVVGTDWYTGMDNENGKGVWTPDGTYRGGHCWVVRGHHSPSAKRSGKILCGNSHDGNFEAVMEYDAFEWLMFAQNGEGACITELPR